MRLRRRPVLLAALLALAAPLAAPTAAAATAPARTSLPAVQDDLMCVACKEPLAVSQAPQANAERGLIRHLIALGYTKAQIEREMVAQYGPAVLAKPPGEGINVSLYALPPAVVVVGLLIVGYAVRKWRMNATPSAPEQAPLKSPDAQRLDEDLAHFKG